MALGWIQKQRKEPCLRLLIAELFAAVLERGDSRGKAPRLCLTLIFIKGWTRRVPVTGAGYAWAHAVGGETLSHGRQLPFGVQGLWGWAVGAVSSRLRGIWSLWEGE